MKREILNQLRKDQKSKTPVALATDLVSGQECLVYHERSHGSWPMIKKSSPSPKHPFKMIKAVLFR